MPLIIGDIYIVHRNIWNCLSRFGFYHTIWTYISLSLSLFRCLSLWGEISRDGDSGALFYEPSTGTLRDFIFTLGGGETRYRDTKIQSGAAQHLEHFEHFKNIFESIAPVEIPTRQSS